MGSCSFSSFKLYGAATVSGGIFRAVRSGDRDGSIGFERDGDPRAVFKLEVTMARSQGACCQPSVITWGPRQ